MNRFLAVFLLSVCTFIFSESDAQYLRAKVGTDIPMQYLFGLNYQQGKFASADVSFGYVGYPYNGDLYRVIDVPEKWQARKEFLMETTDYGYVFGAGLNGHYKKWYGGVFFQRLDLYASASYEYILGSELFREELTQDQKNLVDAFLSEENTVGNFSDLDLSQTMKLNMLAFQGGLKIGRRFFFKNKRWEFRAEFAFSKNFRTTTESEYDEELFDDVISTYNTIKLLSVTNPELIEQLEDALGMEIPLDVDLENILNLERKEDEISEWFHEYGYIPTLNFHLTYLLWVPNKLKKQEDKIEEIKSQFP